MAIALLCFGFLYSSIAAEDIRTIIKFLAGRIVKVGEHSYELSISAGMGSEGVSYYVEGKPVVVKIFYPDPLRVTGMEDR